MRTILVRELRRTRSVAAYSISEDTPVVEVINRYKHDPRLRGIILIDSNKRFSGIISRRDLLQWARYKLFGGEKRRSISAWDIFRIAEAMKAKELVSTNQRSLAVNETDNLQTVIDKMFDHHIGVLPVVDGEGRILGDITVSDVLSKAIELGKKMDGSKE
jgi:CBS domain-containing protein